MFGVTDYVLVVTVHGALQTNRKPTDWFTKCRTVRIAAEQTIHLDTIGNQQVRSDIDKQAYPHSAVETVTQAFGLAGVSFEHYTAFRNWVHLDRHSPVHNRDQIVLLNNALLRVNKQYISEAISRHRIIPMRFDR